MSENSRCDYYKYTRWGSQRCQKPAKAERDGRWYCGIHDPVRLKERQKAQTEKSRIEGERRLRNWVWNNAASALCKNVTAEELEQLGAGWLRRHLDAIKEGS